MTAEELRSCGGRPASTSMPCQTRSASPSMPCRTRSASPSMACRTRPASPTRLTCCTPWPPTYSPCPPDLLLPKPHAIRMADKLEELDTLDEARTHLDTPKYDTLKYHALLVRSRIEGEVFEQTKNSFDIGESKEPKVEVENTDIAIIHA